MLDGVDMINLLCCFVWFWPYSCRKFTVKKVSNNKVLTPFLSNKNIPNVDFYGDCHEIGNMSRT